MNWNNISSSKYKIPIKFGIIYINDVFIDNPFIKLNKLISRYIIKLNNKLSFGPGDVFHSNPIVTAWLHIHPFYFAGKAITGAAEYGCCSIRLGKEDIIINSTKVIFYGEKRCNKSNKIKGATAYLFKTWKTNNIIRVLLGPGIEWYERGTDINNQYYFNNMYLHQCNFDEEKELWKFTLRTWPRNILLSEEDDYKKCRCFI